MLLHILLCKVIITIVSQSSPEFDVEVELLAAQLLALNASIYPVELKKPPDPEGNLKSENKCYQSNIASYT